MRKLILTIAVIVMTVAVTAAQNAASEFFSKAASSGLSFNYTFRVKNNLNMTGEGSVEVFGDAFMMIGNGLEMWCDGNTLWTLDEEAQEIVIEDTSDSEIGYSSNPAVLLGSADKVFNIGKPAASSFKGKSVNAYILTPKQKSDIKSLKLYFAGNALVGATMTAKDATETEFVISGLKFSSRKPASSFGFDVKKLDSSWVITDLR